MPELVKKSKLRTFEVPYEGGPITFTVDLNFPFFKVLRNPAFARMLEDSASMSLSAQMEAAAELLYETGSWDLTENGKPVPFTEGAFDLIGGEATMSALMQFLPIMTEMFKGFGEQAKAAGKSRTGNLPLSDFGRKGSNTKRRKRR